MFGLRLPELLLILVAVLVLFGGNKLPQLGKGLGESIRSFRRALKEAKTDEPAVAQNTKEHVNSKS
ncbi:MAG TPA: twin-arginine translocase TatA/TatE family subunit [Anaeromyxobacteraceae bacterium]|nr:twin-arginine translocase TatA/TatE family subunit [Anaeromyxobacteraceae bacterium]